MIYFRNRQLVCFFGFVTSEANSFAYNLNVVATVVCRREVEAGRGVALASPNFKLVTGKRLRYRPLTGTTETVSLGIARATNGDVTPAGEKFCEILRQTSRGGD